MQKTMKLLNLCAALFILLFFLGSNAFAQENNLSEDYGRYIPEIQTFYKNQPVYPKMAVTPPMIKMVREALDKPVKTTLQPTLMEINGPFGKIGLRIFKPTKIAAVYLDLHGGGNLWGTARSDDSLNVLMARKCNVAVVSVDYHLAPEYPYPAQIRDCSTAAKWLIDNAKERFGTDKIFIGGS